MVTCPTCGESTSVAITPDPDRSRETTPTGSIARWAAHCTTCGSSWTLTDRV